MAPLGLTGHVQTPLYILVFTLCLRSSYSFLLKSFLKYVNKQHDVQLKEMYTNN